MLGTFLTSTALTQLASVGWVDLGVRLGDDPENAEHAFEDETRALQLVVTDRPIANDRWANVWSSFFYHGGRTRYPVAPIVHANYSAGRVAADALRGELRFLKEDGVRLSYASLHRLTAFERKKTVVEGYFIGGQA